MNIFRRKQQPAERKEPPVGNLDAVQQEPVRSETGDSWEVLRGIFGDDSRVAGAVVNEQTAMRVSAVYSCVRLIAGAVASLPLHVYERGGADDRKRIDHPYARYLNREPSPSWPAGAWWEFVLIQMLLRGDSFCYIQRGRSGQVTGLMPLRHSQVVVRKVLSDNPRQAPTLRYLVNGDNGAFGCDAADMLHFPGMGFNGERGMSVIEHGARSGIGIAISADDHAANFFGQGTKIDHVVKATGKMGENTQQAFLDAWRRKYTGKNATGVPLILTEGLDIQELTMTAKDAQLLESRKWQVEDIARAFGAPNHMINSTTGSTSWGSGIEQMSIGFVTYTLQPHLNRIEGELNRKLFQGSTFAEYSAAGLMRGDHAGRSDYYSNALGGTQAAGWMTVNEVRRLENLPPLKEGGDRIYAPEPSNGPNEPA